MFGEICQVLFKTVLTMFRTDGRMDRRTHSWTGKKHNASSHTVVGRRHKIQALLNLKKPQQQNVVKHVKKAFNSHTFKFNSSIADLTSATTSSVSLLKTQTVVRSAWLLLKHISVHFDRCDISVAFDGGWTPYTATVSNALHKTFILQTHKHTCSLSV